MLLTVLLALAAQTDAVACELLFRPHDAKTATAVAADHDLTIVRHLRQIDWYVAHQPCHETPRKPQDSSTLSVRVAALRDAAAKLAADPRVRAAEPNWIPEVRAAPNDTIFPLQWSLDNTGQGNWPANNDINGPDAWPLATGAGVVVAVIDSGVRHRHEDLYAQIAVNAREVENGRDDDGNGYVDDIIGWDFIDDDNDPDDPLPDYDRAAGATAAHGTGVAGLIAATTNNRLGMAGVAPDARLLPLRAIGDGAGVATAAEAILYATDLGVRVQNHSWGTGEQYAQIDDDAMAWAAAHGAVLVLAAGNDNRNLDSAGVEDYPSELDNDAIISVGAMSRGDFLLAFSNHGPFAVDVAAPGGGGLFTTSNIFSGGIWSTGRYSQMSGTSFAAPMVAGVVALMLEADPGLDARQIREALIASSDASRVDVGGTFGGGYVRADRAVAIVLGAAAPPRARIDAPWLEARDWLVHVGATVRLGARVIDPDSDDDDITHHWQLNVPAGSAATIDAHARAPRFVADRCGAYEILHYVDDGEHETVIERRWVYAGFSQPLDVQSLEVCANGLCGYRADDDFTFDVDDAGIFAVHLASTDADGIGGFVAIDADRRDIYAGDGKGGRQWTAPFVGPATVSVAVFSSFEVRRPVVIDALFFCDSRCPAGTFDCDAATANGCETSTPCAVDDDDVGEGEGEGEEGNEGEGEGEEGNEGEGEGEEGNEGEGEGEEGSESEGEGEGEGEEPRDQRTPRPRRELVEVGRHCAQSDGAPPLLAVLWLLCRRRARR